MPDHEEGTLASRGKGSESEWHAEDVHAGEVHDEEGHAGEAQAEEAEAAQARGGVAHSAAGYAWNACSHDEGTCPDGDAAYLRLGEVQLVWEVQP